MSLRRTKTRDICMLLLLCLALYLPGLTVLPPVDRDESLYVLATRQMMASGDLIVPRIGDTPRLIKPIGIYWLQAAALQLTKRFSANRLLGHRLPALVGALGAVLGTYCIGRRWFAGPVATLGAALLASAALLVVEAHLATTDAVLLACVVAAQVALAALFRNARRQQRGPWWLAGVFWLAIAGGILIKGPVAPLVSGLTVATLALVGSAPQRAGGRRLILALRPWWGIPLAALCLAPWLLALVAEVGWQALPRAMASDILPKLGGVHESHGGPPGTYLLMAPATFWPGSLLLVYALTHAWRRRSRPAERFLLAWLVPTWLFFECLPTKLPHYVLPTFPALALLAARAALGATRHLRPPPQRGWVRAAFAAWALLPVVAGAALVVAAARLDAGGWAWFGAASAAVLAVVTSIACWRWSWRNRLGGATCTAIAGAVVLYAVVLQVVLPGLDALWLTRRVAAIAEARVYPGLVMLGFGEPSVAVLSAAPVYFAADTDAALAELRRERYAAVVSDEQMLLFSTAAGERGLVLHEESLVRGFDYTHGRWRTLHVLVPR